MKQPKEKKKISITQKQLKRLNRELPNGIHVVFGTLPVTDEDVEMAIKCGSESLEYAKKKYPEKFK